MKKVFIDMDGVLCEFKYVSSLDCFSEDGFFRNLKPRTAMVQAVKELIGSSHAEVCVLSAVIPDYKDKSIKEKNDWLDKYLPELTSSHRLFTLCGRKKSDYIGSINKDCILLDDFSKNLHDWESAGGVGIKIINEVNNKNGSFKGVRLDLIGQQNLIKAIDLVG